MLFPNTIVGGRIASPRRGAVLYTFWDNFNRTGNLEGSQLESDPTKTYTEYVIHEAYRPQYAVCLLIGGGGIGNTAYQFSQRGFYGFDLGSESYDIDVICNFNFRGVNPEPNQVNQIGAWYTDIAGTRKGYILAGAYDKNLSQLTISVKSYINSSGTTRITGTWAMANPSNLYMRLATNFPNSGEISAYYSTDSGSNWNLVGTYDNDGGIGYPKSNVGGVATIQGSSLYQDTTNTGINYMGIATR